MHFRLQSKNNENKGDKIAKNVLSTYLYVNI